MVCLVLCAIIKRVYPGVLKKICSFHWFIMIKSEEIWRRSSYPLRSIKIKQGVKMDPIFCMYI